jgi:O-antigen ligase
MKSDHLDSAVIGIWLSGIFGARFVWHLLFAPAVFPLYLAVAVVIWPIAYFLISGIRIFPTSYGLLDYFVLGVFSVFSVLSCGLSPVPIFSIGYFAITIAGIYLAQVINTHLSDPALTASLKIYALLMSVLLLVLLYLELSTSGTLRLGRETDILNPNSIAMLAMSVAVAGLIFKRMLLLVLCQIVGLVTIYLTGSRAAALGALIAIAIGLFHRLKSADKAVQLFAITIMVLFVPIFLFYNYDALYNVANSFFLWDDPHRGVRSGMSGRLYTWTLMVDLIRDNWLWGVGFRAHGEFIKASSAHNGYLSTMAEIGIFGFFAIFLFIIYRLTSLMMHWLGKNSSPLINVLFSLSVGYLLIAVFERYLINVGNPVSLIFLIALFRLRPIRQRHTKGSFDELPESI